MTKRDAKHEAARYAAGDIAGLLHDDELWQQFYGDRSEGEQKKLRKAFEELRAKLESAPLTTKGTHDHTQRTISGRLRRRI